MQLTSSNWKTEEGITPLHKPFEVAGKRMVVARAIARPNWLGQALGFDMASLRPATEGHVLHQEGLLGITTQTPDFRKFL